MVGNSFFPKRDSDLITYASGQSRSQIDFILRRKRDLKLVKDIKVIPSEECAPQHKLLVCDLNVKSPAYHSKPFTSKCRIWKLPEPQAQADFEQVFTEELNSDPAADESIEGIWTRLKRSLLSAADRVCGRTSTRHLKRVTWWWDDVNAAVSEKRCWKAWKEGGSKEEYLNAKHLAKRSVYTSKSQAEANKFANLRSGNSDTFKMWLAISVSRMIQETYPSMTTLRKSLGNSTMSAF